PSRCVDADGRFCTHIDEAVSIGFHFIARSETVQNSLFPMSLLSRVTDRRLKRNRQVIFGQTLSSTLSIFRARKARFDKPFTSNARVFQCRVFKRRLKTPSDCGNCKSFIGLARDQNGQSRAKWLVNSIRSSIPVGASCVVGQPRRG